MLKRSFLVVSLLALSVSSVSAQLTGPTGRANSWEITVQTRYAGEQTHNGTTNTSAQMEADLGWGIGAGYNLNERFNLGFLVTWRSANYTATVVSEVDPEDTMIYSNWLDADTLALTADWNVLSKRLTPYVNGALGWTLINTNIPANIYSGCWWDPWYGYVCASDVETYGADVFSYAIGVGARLEVSDNVFFRVGYEYDGLNHDGTDGINAFRLDLGFTAR